MSGGARSGAIMSRRVPWQTSCAALRGASQFSGLALLRRISLHAATSQRDGAAASAARPAPPRFGGNTGAVAGKHGGRGFTLGGAVTRQLPRGLALCRLNCSPARGLAPKCSRRARIQRTRRRAYPRRKRRRATSGRPVQRSTATQARCIVTRSGFQGRRQTDALSQFLRTTSGSLQQRSTVRSSNSNPGAVRESPPSWQVLRSAHAP